MASAAEIRIGIGFILGALTLLRGLKNDKLALGWLSFISCVLGGAISWSVVAICFFFYAYLIAIPSKKQPRIEHIQKISLPITPEISSVSRGIENSGSPVPKSFFHDHDEVFRGVLGQGYITSIINMGSVSRSILILTNKRLYQVGKVYERTMGYNFVSTAGKKIVNVRDITGTSFQEVNKVSALILGWIFVILGILSFILSGYLEDSLGCIIFGITLMSWGFLSLLIYAVTRRRLFVVEYAGGAVATHCKWYSPSEIDNFQRAISLEKDRIAESQNR